MFKAEVFTDHIQGQSLTRGAENQSETLDGKTKPVDRKCIDHPLSAIPEYESCTTPSRLLWRGIALRFRITSNLWVPVYIEIGGSDCYGASCNCW